MVLYPRHSIILVFVMKAILQKLLKFFSLALLFCAQSITPMEKDHSKDSIEFVSLEAYDKNFTYQNPFDGDRLGTHYDSLDTFKASYFDVTEQYKQTFEPLDVPQLSYDQPEQTHDHFKPLQDSMYKEDFGSLVDNTWDSSTATSASYYKTDKASQIIAMERVQREKELISIEQKLESLIDYNTSGKHFYARPLLTDASKDFSKFGPDVNAALKDTIDDINEIICYANGRFKHNLTKEEVNAVSYVYANYLERTCSVRGHDHYRSKLTALADKNNVFADALKKYAQTDCNRWLEMAHDIAHVISQPAVILVRIIKKGYAAHIYSVSHEAQYNNVNQIGNLIARYIKEGNYEMALVLGKQGYFECYPLIAETIKQDCNRLMHERDAKRALHKEVVTLAEHSKSRSAHKEAKRIIVYALRAREATDKGDMVSNIAYADKAWNIKNAEKEAPLIPSAASAIQLTLRALKIAHKDSLKQGPFDLSSFKKKQSLFPETKKFLKENDIDPETFIQKIEQTLDSEKIQEAVQKILQETKALEDATETPDKIATRFYGLIGKKIIDNITSPHTFIKRSLVDPIILVGSVAGNFWEKYGDNIDRHMVTIIQLAMLSDDFDNGIDNPELRKMVVEGVDLLSEDISKSVDAIKQAVKEIPQKIEMVLTLPPEQAEELVSTLYSDLITAKIFSSAFSLLYKNLDNVKTEIEAIQLVDEMEESRVLQAMSNKTVDNFKAAEKLEKLAQESKHLAKTVKKAGKLDGKMGVNTPQAPTIVTHAKEELDFVKTASNAQQLPKLGSEIKPLSPAKTVGKIVKEEGIASQTASTIQKGEQVAQETSAVSKAAKIGKSTETTLMTEEKARKIWAESREFQELEARVTGLKKVTNDTRIGTHYTLDAKIDKVENLAQKTYENIRIKQDDVVKISENTGISRDCIKKIKNHVFIKEHNLQGGKSKFSADLDIADAWNRLTTGEFVQSDLEWMKHEYAEALIMNKTNIDWRTAHDIVNEKYNWQNLIG